MVTSQNGYPAGDRTVLYNPVVPGTGIDFPGGLRRGPAGELLLYVAAQLHARVENGGDGYGMWGYAYRPIRGFAFPSEDDRRLMAAAAVPPLASEMEFDEANRACCFDNEDVLFGASSLSNHSSGTAFDWKAPSHPLGAVNTFSRAQISTIRAIVNVECAGAVRWGGDYSGRKDEMHFEINKGAAAVSALADRIRREENDMVEWTDKPWGSEYTVAQAIQGTYGNSGTIAALAASVAQLNATAAGILANVKADDAEKAAILADAKAKHEELLAAVSQVDEQVWAKVPDPGVSVAEKADLLRAVLGDDAAAVGALLAQA